jgi:hypothetical protein
MFGKISLHDMIKDAMSKYGIPSSHLSDGDVVAFIDKVVATVANSMRAYCYNLARQRRRIARVLEEWAALQMEGNIVDEKLGGSREFADIPRYLGCWLLHNVAPLMVQYLVLGFQLELYSTDEYPMIFWYLDYIFGIAHQNTNYISHMKELEIAKGYTTNSSKGGGKKKTGKSGKPKPNKKKSVPPPPTPYQIYLEAQHNLVRGMSRMLYGVKCFNKPVQFPFGSPETKFYQRFGPFHKLDQPTPLFYNHYLETTDPTVLNGVTLLQGAAESFRVARTSIEKLVHQYSGVPGSSVLYNQENLHPLAKVCISNTLQLQLLFGKTKFATVPLPSSYDFGVHKHYPVVSWK